VRRRVLFGVVLCVLGVAARADQVTLKNGDRLTGTIGKSDAKTMLIKTELAGEVNVQWDAVTSIASSQPLHLGLKDGQTVVGTVATADGKFEVATKTAGEVTAPKDAVVTVRNDDEEKSYDAEIDRLRNPRLTAATKLKSWLGWQVTYSDRYLSDPLPGLKKNDVLLSTGLRLTFGKGAL
jgi:hypothetical protein